MTEIRVLLIDDDPGEQRALAGYLREVAQFKVKAYAAGRQALEHLRTAREDYTAVLLDYVLKAEGMSGRQLLSKIREEHPYLPVIVFTGLDPARGVQALSEGAYRYLRKRLDLAEVVNIVRNLAEQEAIFRRMAQDVRQMLGSDMCLAWRLDRRARRFRIVAWDGDRDLDAGYRRTTFLDLDAEATHKLFEKKNPIFISDVRNPDRAPYYLHRDYAAQQGWTSLISIPLLRQDRIVGLVDSYTYKEITDKQKLSHWLQVTLPPFARQAAESAWSAELSDRLQALQGLTEVLAETFEEGTILQQILAKGIELVGAEAGWVYRLDVNREKLVLKKGIGVTEDQIGPERGLGEGITGRVAQTGQALNVPDVTTPSQEYQHLKIPGLEVRSEVAVPLRRGEQIIGALAVTSPLPDAFTAEDVSLLSSLAAQAAVAIGHADVTRHSQELGRLALTGDYERLAQYVVEAARDLTGADVILWMMGDEADIEITEEEKEKGPWLRVKTSKGNIDADYLKKAKTPTAPGSSLTALALERGQPVIRRDIWDETEAPGEPRFHNLPAAEQHGWRAFMAVPLLGRGKEPLGSLSLYGQETAKFGEAEVGLMRAFANQVAIALENVQVMARLDTQLEKLHQIVQSRSLEEVLDQTLNGINSILGAGASSSINLYDAFSDSFEPSRAAGPLKLLLGVPLRPDGTGRYVLRTKKPLYLDDVRQPPPGCPTIREAASEHNLIKSFAALPLIRQEQVIGVLFVSLQTPIPFSPAIRRILELFTSQAAIAIENARLLREIAKSRERLARLQEVSAISSEGQPDLRETLRKIVENLSDIIPGGACAIRMYDSSRDRFGIWVAAGPLRNWRKLPRPKGTSRYVIDNKTALYIEDAEATLPESQPAVREEFKAQGVKAIAALPLISKGDVKGILYVDLLAPHRFSPSEKQILELFANQAAIAIENIRLYERRVHDISVLQDVNEAIASKDLDEVLNLVVKRALEIIPGEYGSLWLLDPVTGDVKTNDLILRAKHGPRGQVKRVGRIKATEKGTCRRVVESGEGKICHDVSEIPGFYRIYKPAKSSVTVPLVYRNRVMGALNVESARAAAFSEQHKQLLGSLAAQAAVAIETARLLTETRQRLAELDAIYQISLDITAELDSKTVLRKVIEQATRLLEFRGGAGLGGGLLLADHTAKTVQIAVEYNLRKEAEGVTFGFGEGMAGHVVQTREPLIVNNYPRWAGRAKVFDEEPLKGMLKSVVQVPLIWRDEAIGVLAISDATGKRTFDEHDVELLQRIASQAAIAMQNALLYTRRVQDIAALHKVNAAIRTARVDEVLVLILEQLQQVVPYDSASVQRLRGESVEIVACRGFERPHEILDKRFTLDPGNPNFDVIKKREPVVVEDTSRDYPHMKDELGRPRSWLGVPLLVRGEPIGMIALDRMEMHPFNQGEKELAGSFADQAAIAIDNARLVEELKERIADLDRLRELSEELSAGVWLGEG